MWPLLRARLACVALGLLLQAAPAADPATCTLHLAGDSTLADKPLRPAHPERGWGQMLPLYVSPQLRIANHAMNGRSTRSFLAEGRWKTLLERVQPGDFVLIQFGHNDEKTVQGRRVTEPFGSFQENLERFVRDVRARRATPILATPIVRRRFDAEGRLTDTHGDYPEGVRRAAARQQAPLLELHDRSRDLLARLGPERSLALFCHAAPGEYERAPDGLKDDTHLSPTGASRICDLAVEEIAARVPELARHLRK